MKYEAWSEYYKERSKRAKEQLKRLLKADMGLLIRQGVNYILILNLLALLGHVALSIFPDSLKSHFSDLRLIQLVVDAFAGVIILTLIKAIKGALSSKGVKASDIVSINDVFAFGRRLTNQVFIWLISVNITLFIVKEFISYLKSIYGYGKSISSSK